MNSTQIDLAIKGKYKFNINIDNIKNILNNIRKTISNAIKQIYITKQKVGPPESKKKL